MIRERQLAWWLTGAALVLVVTTVVISIVVVPARINLRTYTIACETLVFPQRHDPIVSALCERAGAYRLRATFGIAALLAVLSLVPLAVQRTRALVLWGVAFVVLAASTVTILAVVGTRHQTLFFDL